LNIAIIGLGEVGRCYATALASLPGVRLHLCDTHLSPAGKELATARGLPVHADIGPWLASADWVLSCVFGSAALAVASNCHAHMKAGASYADLTTASPEDKRKAAAAASAAGLAYVDVAVMGAISLSLHRTPLLCAGASAAEFCELVNAAGGKAEAVEGGVAGDAISLKILRSVFTKGMEALAVDVLLAAERQQLRPALYEVLKDIDQAPLPAFLEMLVSTHVVHATRRLHEVEEAERQLASLGIASSVLGGVRQRFSHSSEGLALEPITEEQPSLAQALDWLGRHTPAA